MHAARASRARTHRPSPARGITAGGTPHGARTLALLRRPARPTSRTRRSRRSSSAGPATSSGTSRTAATCCATTATWPPTGTRCPTSSPTRRRSRSCTRWASAACRALFLSGGEPMMRKNFWEILELARSYGIRVTVSTNCTLIDRDAAKRLKANGIDWIATSLYGPAEFHDAMVRRPRHPRPRHRGHQDPARGGRRRRDQDRDQPGHLAVHLRPHRRGQGARRRPHLLLRPHHRRPQRGRGRRPHHRRAVARARRLHRRGHPAPSESKHRVGHRRDAELHPLRRREVRRARHRRQQRPRAPQDHQRLPGGQGPHEHQLRGRHHALPVRPGLDDRQRPRDDAAARPSASSTSSTSRSPRASALPRPASTRASAAAAAPRPGSAPATRWPRTSPACCTPSSTAATSSRTSRRRPSSRARRRARCRGPARRPRFDEIADRYRGLIRCA